MPSVRLTNLAIVLACTGLMAYALYAQEVLGLHPCPLCVSQRIFVIAVGLVALVALIHNPARILFRRIYAGLGMLAAVVGGAVAGRHVYIQNLPEDEVPACGPGLDYIFDTFPFFEAVTILFRGDGNCAEVDWQFVGLSMPAWVLIAFAGLFLVNAWQLVRHK